MYKNQAQSAYAQNSVAIESPARLIEMLYEGVLRFNSQAKKAIGDGDIEKKVYWINRSIAIITELISTLDMSQKGSMAEYLNGLYNYEIQLLNEAMISSTATKIDEVSSVFKVLLETWREDADLVK
ncbi:MAG: flagellar export chaperone FliS [Sulfurimonas sp.]|jgi:flagellar protein FliS|nr:flagellar export chaperone FliS [Sulfurimonadaceae bacterium]